VQLRPAPLDQIGCTEAGCRQGRELVGLPASAAAFPVRRARHVREPPDDDCGFLPFTRPEHYQLHNFEDVDMVVAILVSSPETAVSISHPVPEPLIEMIAERFHLLAEPMRIRILDQLRDGPMSVGALGDALGTSQQNVSKHLGLLLRAGVVAREKQGTLARYRIVDPSVFDLCEQVCGGLQRRIEQQWALIGQEVA
jgi:DNA-binding transcriptional ArsR family regulator